MLRNSNVDVRHVGDKSYSSLSARALNDKFDAVVEPAEALELSSLETVASSARVSTEESGATVLVTAEITTNHFGDLDRLEKMVSRAKDAGADLVKVQKRDPETFYTKSQLSSPFQSPFGTTFGDYRRSLELDREGFTRVVHR